jgi:hypothetical protein
MIKNATAIISFLKMVAKYGAYCIVIFDTINFAIERIETINKEKTKSDA